MKRKLTQNVGRLFMTGLLFFMSVFVYGQTVLINPNAEGGFESGPTMAANGWTVVNTTTTNGPQWYTSATSLTQGTYTFAPTGLNCAYISSDLGTSWSYQTPSTGGGSSNFYRDVTFPPGQTNISLSFRYNASGESTWDDIHVYLCPVTLTPVMNQPASTSTAPTWTGTGTPVYLGRYNLLPAGAGAIANLSIPASVAGNCSAASTMRLVFVWKNDTGGGTNPPAAIDDISLVSSSSTFPSAGGVFTIDNTLPTIGTNFASFTDAINAINGGSACGPFTGPITVNVAAGQMFMENPPVLTASGTSVNTITFQKAGAGSNPVIMPSGTTGSADAGIIISGGDYITFDGIDVNASAVSAVEYGYVIRNSSAIDGATYNTIKNTTVTLNNLNTASCGISITNSTSYGAGVTPTNQTGANSYNKLYNLTISNALNGVIIYGSSTYKGIANEVGTTACTIRNSISNIKPGTGLTYYAARGIYPYYQESVKIFNTDISAVAGNQSTAYGIYAYYCYGASEIYNNKISNISVEGSTGTTSGARGIDVSMGTSGTQSVKLYNNFVSNIYTSFTGTATTSQYAYGMYIGSGSSTCTYEIDNNSVSIGAGLTPTYSNTCVYQNGSTAKYIYRGNIFANFTGAQGATAKHKTITTSSTTSIGAAGSLMNYNDLYVANDLGTSGVIAGTTSTHYLTLATAASSYTTPAGAITNSISEDPLFVNFNSDLHAQAVATDQVAGFSPQAWVSSDIDCEARASISPNDLGADAYNVVYCAGTPSSSTTVSTTASACSGVPFTLSLGTTYSGVGFTYQWQSSADGITFTNITGATNSVLSTSMTAQTVYQCVVTCSVSSSSITSTPVTVALNSFLNCYCASNATSTGDDDLGQVSIGSLLNPTSAPSSLLSNATSTNTYTNFTTLPAVDFALGSVQPISITQINSSTYYYQCDLGIYIDYNQDGDFGDAGETVYTGVGPATAPAAAPHFSGNITVPLTATLGITRMRIVLNETGTTTSCGTYSYGETEDYNINIVCPTLVKPTGVDAAICSGSTAALSATSPIGTISWYTTATGGTSVQTGTAYTTPTLTTTTPFYAQVDLTGCPSSPRDTVVATVDAVNVTLSSVNVTCNGYTNGSFALGTVQCGTAPFTYAVNGGTFGAIPTDLAAGTYSVVVKDAVLATSSPISVVITQPSTVINIPTGTGVQACLGLPAASISASSTLSVVNTVNASYNLGTAVNVAGYATINASVTPVIPAGATITATSLVFYGVSTAGGNWPSDMTVALSGATTLATGVMAPVNLTVTGQTYTKTPSMLSTSGAAVNYTLVNTYSGTATIDSVRLLVTYTLPNPVAISWYSAATGGTLLGTGGSLNPNGTVVLPTTNTAGTYNFYAEGSNAGCNSISRGLVTVVVNALPTVNAGSDVLICSNNATQQVTLTGSGSATTYAWNNGATNATPFSVGTTTTYTLTGTDANGCVNTDQVVVTYSALPVVNAGPDVTACQGENVTLTAYTVGTTPTWNNNVINGFPFATTVGSTVYTVSTTNTVGCSNTDAVTVNVTPAPTVVLSADQAICTGSNALFSASVTNGSQGTWSTDGFGTITPNTSNTSVYYTPSANDAATVHIMFASLAFCGSASDTAIVTVKQTPVVNAGADVSVCAGSSATLTASGADTYVWTNAVVDGQSFVPTATTTYTVTGTNANGCSSTDAATVTVNAMPNAVATASDALNIHATPVFGAEYQWINCANNQVIPGATSDSYTAKVNGTYAVVVTNASGCSDTSACVIINTVGLDNVLADNAVTLYPNPTTGNMFVQLNSIETINAVVYDAQGKLIATLNNLKNGSVIDLTSVETGIYMIHLNAENASMIQRVIKN